MASAPPSPASPLPSAKVTAKTRSTSMPSPRAMRWLSTAARTCAPKRVYSSASTSTTVISERHADQEQPVDAEILAEDRDGAAQVGRQLHRLLDRAVDVGGDRDRDEDNADRQQALVEIARAVEPAIEHALEHHAHHRRRQERERQRREERPAELSWSSVTVT